MELAIALILITLLLIIKQNQSIMATLAELNEKVTELQAAVDAEQQQIAELLATNAGVIVDLNAQINALKLQLEGTPSPEAIQAVIDGLDAIKKDVEGTVSTEETPSE
jgi:uncharacterized protein YoxC